DGNGNLGKAGMVGDDALMADAAILDRYQHGALIPLLADATSLQIAGKDHQRVLADDLEIMHMPERPVVVTARAQIVDRARGIGGMRLAAGQRGVQYADIEP